MITIFVKSYFIFFFTLYFSFKILNFSITRFLRSVLFLAPFPLVLLSYFLDIYFVEIKYILPLLLIWISIGIYSKQPQLSFITSNISFAISYCTHALASFIVSLLAFILCGTPPSLSYTLLALISSSLQAIFVILFLRIKRFKYGMSFLVQTSIINVLTILCLIFINVPIYVYINRSYDLGLFSISFLLAFLIYWWQAQITKSYRRSLELRELESLRTELQEKNATIVKVMEENERIRHINHRDNGLITALDYAVNDYLVTDFTDETAAKARRDELLIEIERIRAGRVSSVNKDKVKATRYETNISLLNILLNQTSKRATDEHVLFSVHFGTELEDFIPRIISEDDLAHLLSDMLENAFIATRDVKNPMIQLQFYKWNKHFVIEIADNGIPFEVDSILNMGISELTTHADTGGSGIGLMDIWSTKEKYGATYHIDEYETPAPFSKKISLTFDKKNRYSVRTWRKDEISAVSKRADLQVYGQDE